MKAAAALNHTAAAAASMMEHVVLHNVRLRDTLKYLSWDERAFPSLVDCEATKMSIIF